MRAAASYRAALRNTAKRSEDWKLAREFRRKGRSFGFTISRCVATLAAPGYNDERSGSPAEATARSAADPQVSGTGRTSTLGEIL